MRVLCLSVTHHTTPLSLRECLSLSPQQIEEVLERHPIRSAPFESIRELTVLSSCNRLELYAVINPMGYPDDRSGNAGQPVIEYLDKAFGLPAREMSPYLQYFSDGQAVEHLFKVTAGLDSIAVGETQILGQVSRALENSLKAGGAHHVLSSLFRSAIHAGKRVHSETEVGRHPTSISHLAVQLARHRLGTLAGRRVLIVGAGKMGTYAIHALQGEGVQAIILVNRTFEHAAHLAEGTGVVVANYDSLADELTLADVVFTSTAAPGPIIHQAMVAEVMRARQGKPLFLVDLAVPRNVEAEVKSIRGVTLVDMDDLQAFVSTNQDGQPEINQAQAIVDEEVSEYMKMLRIIPFIGELHRKIELIRQRELEKTMRNLKQVDPQIGEQLELFSRSLVQKIIHEPTMHLRTESDEETLNDYVDTLARLFDLSEGKEAIPEPMEGK